MNQYTVNHVLKNFLNKPCSFFVVNHQKGFTQDDDVLYFAGTIKEISNDGILYSGFRNGKLNWINFAHLIAICEEEIVLENSKDSSTLPETIEDAEKFMDTI